MSKKYENRYWEVGEYNGMINGKLHFTQYNDDQIILGFQQDKDDDNLFWYVSEFLNVENDCIFVHNPDEAMQDFEDMINDYIENEICLLEDLKEKFNKLVG